MSAPIRVALVSPCGWGNLGDAAIFDSVIAAVRRRLGDVGIVGLTMNPDDTARRHGIEARSLLGYSRPQFPVMAPGGARRPEAPAGVTLPPWLRSARTVRRALTAGGLFSAPRAYERESAAALAGCQLVVVAGGGQLDELWGGALAQPVALWRWSAVARRLGARFVVLSVGTGKLDSPLGRRLVGRALAAAQVVSFRDAGSRDLAPVPRAHACTLVPDLAYAVPRPTTSPSSNGRARPLVALGPISHRDPRGSPEEDADAYGRNVRALAALARRLVETDHDVALFTTAPSDEATVKDLLAALADAPAVAARLRAHPAAGASVAGLLAFLATADVVVAARLHAVLLSHVMGRPVVALSYERKVEALMRDTGQTASCLDLDGLDAEEAFAAVTRALRDGPALSAAIAIRVAGFRDAVESQYDRVFGPVGHHHTDQRD